MFWVCLLGGNPLRSFNLRRHPTPRTPHPLSCLADGVVFKASRASYDTDAREKALKPQRQAASPVRLERHDIPAVLGTGQTFDTLLTCSIKKPINAVKAPPEADEGRTASSTLYRHTGFGNRILLQSPTLKRTLSSEKVIWRSYRASTNFTVPAVEEIKRPVRSVPCRVRHDRGLTESRPFIVSLCTIEMLPISPHRHSPEPGVGAIIFRPHDGKRLPEAAKSLLDT